MNAAFASLVVKTRTTPHPGTEKKRKNRQGDGGVEYRKLVEHGRNLI